MGSQKKSYTLSDLANRLEAKFQGDPQYLISGLASLASASKHDIAFLDNVRYRVQLETTHAGVVIMTPEIAENYSGNAIICQQPYLAYAKVAHLFVSSTSTPNGIHKTAVVEAGCKIDPSASIGPYCVIGVNTVIGPNVQIGAHCSIAHDVNIGANTTFYPRVTVYHGVSIGERVILHSGAVIGSDGFGLANEKGRWIKIPQLGSVVIGNDVEIGANTTIDRGALDNTVIEEGVKLDNQIQVAHNVKIGAHTAIAANTVIAGSTEIGKYCMIGGASSISGHLKITDGVKLTGCSQVSNHIKEKGVYSSGTGLQTNSAWKRNLVRWWHLDEFVKRLQNLEKKLS